MIATAAAWQAIQWRLLASYMIVARTQLEVDVHSALPLQRVAGCIRGIARADSR
jgi:hypothetical protein